LKNLFDANTYHEVVNRMDSLTPQTQRQWGKMDVAQMLAHLKESFKVPLSETKMPRMFLGYILGWMIKPKLYDDSVIKKSVPTSPAFVINDTRDFYEEGAELKAQIDQFHNGDKNKIGQFPHPMFGSFTQDQWGKAMYKHLDHHLTQFGA